MDQGPDQIGGPQRLRMVNHPFGGVMRGGAALHALGAMAADAAVDAALRETIRGDLRLRLAEVTFASLRETTGADIIVASMLHPEHVRANVAAIDSERFSSAELAQVRGRLQELRTL